MSGIKQLEKRGFVFFEDSQYYIFERRELNTKLFDQIKIKLDTKTVKCTTYVFSSRRGYKEEALVLDRELIIAILAVVNELKKKEEQK